MTDQTEPLIIRRSPDPDGNPEVLNPSVIGDRGYLIVPAGTKWERLDFPDARPMNETLADAEPDPLRSWMLSYPGHAEVEPPEPGAGPGWGDQDDLDNARCCPWCRGSLTAHNRAVHAAGASMGERHATEGAGSILDQFTKSLRDEGHRLPPGFVVPTNPGVNRDPWAGAGAGYDVRVLRAGLQAIASDASAREDHHTAAYAHSVLAGEPIPPTPPEDPDPLGDGTDPEAVEALLDAAARWGQAGVIRVARALFHADAWHTSDPGEAPEPSAEDLAPRVYIGGRREVTFLGEHVPETGVLLLPGAEPDHGPITASDLGPLQVPEPEPLCAAAAYGVRFASCDLRPGHNSQHHAWYDAGHGPVTVLWDA